MSDRQLERLAELSYKENMLLKSSVNQYGDLLQKAYDRMGGLSVEAQLSRENLIRFYAKLEHTVKKIADVVADHDRRLARSEKAANKMQLHILKQDRKKGKK